MKICYDIHWKSSFCRDSDASAICISMVCSSYTLFFSYCSSDPAEFNSSQDSKPSSSGSNSSAASLNISQSSTSQESSQAAPDPIVITPPTTQDSSSQACKLPLTDRHPSSRRQHQVGFCPAPLRRGRKRKSVETSPIPLSNLQKTALYSINPFGIPVRYLNPKAKPEESTAVVAPAKVPSHVVVVHTASAETTQSQPIVWQFLFNYKTPTPKLVRQMWLPDLTVFSLYLSCSADIVFVG